nr:hypothetical protein [Sedimentibacter sp.]
MKKVKYGEYKKLKLILFENKINYKEAAKIADLSVSAFSNKINGFADFRVHEISKLSYALGVDYTIILNEIINNEK